MSNRWRYRKRRNRSSRVQRRLSRTDCANRDRLPRDGVKAKISRLHDREEPRFNHNVGASFIRLNPFPCEQKIETKEWAVGGVGGREKKMKRKYTRHRRCRRGRAAYLSFPTLARASIPILSLVPLLNTLGALKLFYTNHGVPSSFLNTSPLLNEDTGERKEKR